MKSSLCVLTFNKCVALLVSVLYIIEQSSSFIVAFHPWGFQLDTYGKSAVFPFAGENKR